MVAYVTTKYLLFGSIYIVTVSYGRSTFTSASSALVDTFSTYFSTNFGVKVIWLFYRVWIFCGVIA